MTHDVFAEQIVARRSDGLTLLKKIASAAACAVLLIIIANIPALAPFLPFLCVGIILVAVALIRSMSFEYEYSVSGGELSVDIIRGRSRRRRRATISLERVSALARDSEPMFSELQRAAERTLDFASAPNAAGRVGIMADADGRRTFLVLEPDARMYEAIVKSLPAAVRISVKENG